MENYTERMKELNFAAVDIAFGDMIARRSEQEDDSSLRLLAAAALNVTASSHSCLDLDKWLDKYGKTLPSLEEWKQNIETKWEKAIAIKGTRDTGTEPLVWVPDFNALYLRQYLQAEEEILSFVKNMNDAQAASIQEEDIIKLNPTRLQGDKASDQVHAIKQVFQKKFAIITGGPGTGKTTTLVTLLALELLSKPSGLKIALCAPTGKAAEQMKQSILDECKYLDVSDKIKSILADLPKMTIHKLLGITPSDGGRAKYSKNKRLKYTMVVVDECSMVSLLLFKKLQAALPENGRLLLLGDKDQLDSVESGKVFSELCSHSDKLGITCARLNYNFRSEKNPALVKTAQMLAKGLPSKTDAQKAIDELFKNGKNVLPEQETVFGALEVKDKQFDFKALIGTLISEWLGEIPKYKSKEEALKHLNDFKVLCAVHEGAFGVKKLNDVLADIFLGDSIQSNNYPDGLPILITENDNTVTHLQNGDVGMCWDKKVWFPSKDTPQGFLPAQLPPHEKAFAMTVHKAQGASYENVITILPPELPNEEHDLYTINLVYTAITRARGNCLVLSGKQVLLKAISTATVRWGHLFQ